MGQQATLQRSLELLMLLNNSFGKTVKELSERFDISNRTVYRYLDTIKEAGFVIDNNNGHYKIDRDASAHDISKLLHFSEEEAFILSKAIHEIETDGGYKRKLAQKLYSLYNFDRVVYAINKKEDSENILSILKAIKKKKQIILKNYKSGNSNTIRDRILEPIDFTYHYNSLWAFDTEDKKNKIFRTSRFSDVLISEENYRYSSEHSKGVVDVFRFSGFDPIRVKLSLSLRAYTLLIEEYPLAQKDITPISNYEYEFNTKTCGFEGIGRFVMGLPGEIVIHSPDSFKAFISKKLDLLKK